MTRDELIGGLKAVIALYESHDDLPLPLNVSLHIPCTDTKEEVARVARLLGRTRKNHSDCLFTLEWNHGEHVTCGFIFMRQVVCRRVETQVVRKATDEIHIPAQPERIETKTEWICDEPILAESH